MSNSLLLPSLRVPGGTRWNIANTRQGLCTPTDSSNGTFGTLEECHRFARPRERQLSWIVTNSSGYGEGGAVVGECRPTLDPSPSKCQQFSDPLECASSCVAQYSAYPDPARKKGWICSNPALGQCMMTENTNVPFSYHVYDTYEDCKNAPECNMDTSDSMGPLRPFDNTRPDLKWYIDAQYGMCTSSRLSSAPFDTFAGCQKALRRCGPDGLPIIQYSNPIQATDAHWREPYIGFRLEPGRIVTDKLEPSQVPLNPVDRIATVGTQQIIPGLAGQGYNVLG